MTQGAAFFDLDRTLRASVSMALIGRAAGGAGRAQALVALAGGSATRPLRRWAGVGEPDLPQGAVLELLAGHSETEVERWARTIATTEILPRLNPQIVEIVARWSGPDTPSVLVTVAPRELATAVAATLDIDHVLATEAERGPDGRFTGRAEGRPLVGAAKLTAVRELAAREGIDLARSHVYSDRSGSRELLEAVGFPHVVNPDQPLRDRAVEQGWAVHEIPPVHWLWAVELPGLSQAVAALLGLAAGLALGARRARRRP
jgi:HAD superfamily hydrolase (TIGR01490 family)